MVVRVTREAIAHAGIEAGDIDEIVLGHFNAGFSAQDFTASLVLQADDALRFKATTRVENACATGSAAVQQAVKTIEAKRAKVVLVVGVEQMTTTPGKEIGRNLLKASYLPEDGEIEGGFCRRVRSDRRWLFPAPWRPVRRARHDRGQEPRQRRLQPLCPDAQGSRLRVLPHRIGEETPSLPARSSAPIAPSSRMVRRRSSSPMSRRACA